MDYKVVVVVLLKGGADSFNYLIPGPADYCRDDLSYDEYQARRGSAALPRSEIKKMAIEVPDQDRGPFVPPFRLPDEAAQPCSRFYLHPNMTNIRNIYQAGDAAFFANIGNLVEPVTRQTLKAKTVKLPPQLFAHDQQQRFAQTVDPLTRTNANGVLGKMADAVANEMKTDIFTFDRTWKASQADSTTATVLDKKKGVKKMHSYQTSPTFIDELAQGQAPKSHFAETYYASLKHSLKTTEELAEKLHGAEQEWLSERSKKKALKDWEFGDDNVGKQFSILSQIINLRKKNIRQSHRDVFVVWAKGFDTHGSYAPPEDLKNTDNAVGAFRQEMKRQGLWDDTVVVSVSDFGRSLTPNAAGTDHGWGGNYFAVGGKVKQGVLGQYPASLAIDNDMDNGHGTIIPHRGWDTMWAPIADWFGVPSDKHEDVLPNLRNFPEFTNEDGGFASALFEP